MHKDNPAQQVFMQQAFVRQGFIQQALCTAGIRKGLYQVNSKLPNGHVPEAVAPLANARAGEQKR